MEVGELSAEDDVVTKEGLSYGGKTGKTNEVLAMSRKQDEDGIVTNKPRVTYSKEDLLNLRESPASKLWPSALSDEHVRHGIWDPEAWHQSYASEKRCASPGEELKKQFAIEDGIVLSPQRQSFGQGCHIPQSAPERLLQERGKSGLSRTTDREREGRSRLTGRVGRGRTLDYKERTPLQERNKDSDEPSGKYTGTRDWEREERTDRDRGYSKDKERGLREREKERKRSREEPVRGRNIQVRKRQARGDANEEPEWFTFGPSSQFETMELKGFDDVEDPKKARERRKSASDEIKAILSVGKDGPMNDELKVSSPQTDSGPSKKSAVDKKMEAKANDDNKQKAKPFDINDFFVSDTLLSFTGGGVDQASSRFCQFFGQPGSNYSSSRSGSAGLSSGGANTPRTPSPAPNYLFTPITPSADDYIESHGLATMLQKSQISVQPLLDEVMSSGKETGKVMGSVRLEDIEADVKQESKSSVKKEIIDMSMEHNKENIDKDGEMSNKPAQMVAFNMLVEKMKSSGTLPEKPQPAISGLPTRLLPRPPSPKRKTPRNSPSPLQDLRRSPSPTELLKRMTMTAPLSDPRPPSPAQVVPQMNRVPSPLEMFHKFNSVVTSPQDLFASPLLRRSPSPLSMLAQQRQSPPLGFGPLNMQMVPNQVPQLYQTRPQPGSMPHRANQQMMRKQQERHVTPGGLPEQRSHTVVHPKPVSSQSGSPHITDRSFMPTSVMRKIQQDRLDQKTPKTMEKTQAQDQSKEKNVAAEVLHTTVNRKDASAPGTPPRQPFKDQDSSQLRAPTQDEGDFIKGVLFQQHPNEKQATSQTNAIKHDHLLSPKSMISGEARLSQDGSPVLQKPTAFKPLPGSPQVPFSSLKGGVNSEPAFPLHLFNQNLGSPSRPSKVLPNSAPCTPQRHPLVDKTALLSPQQLVSKGMMPRDDGNKPLVGLFGHNGSMESQAKGVRDGITRVVAANEGRPLTHSYEQQAHISSDKASAYEDTFHAKRSGLSGSHPVSHHSQNNMGVQRMNSNEVTAHHEGLPPNHPAHRIHGGETRPTPVQHVPRQFHGAHGPRPAPHLLNGRLSPSNMPAMHGHPGRTPFNSPMPGMSPRSAMHPGMIPRHMHPAYLRMLSSAGSPMGMPSPGMNPASMRMQMPHSAGRYPVMPGHHPAMMYGGRPSPGYPPVNPAAAAAAAAMMGARSPHIPPQTGLQQSRRVASPVMNHPSQSHSPGGGGNILSKWFSEDVLQQVHPGQRSITPDFTRKFVSVEELERQQAAAFN